MNPDVFPAPPGTRFVVGEDNYPFLEHIATGERVLVSGDGWASSGPVPPWATWLPPNWAFEWWPLGVTPEHVREFVGLVDVYADSKHMPPDACRAGRMLAHFLIGPTLPASKPFSSIYPPSDDPRTAWRTVRDDLLAWRPPAAAPAVLPQVASEPAAHGLTSSGGKCSLAMSVLAAHPRPTLEQIAAAVGVRRQRLYDSPEFKVFRDAAERVGLMKPRAKRGTVRRGSKTADGCIEAHADRDD